MQRLILVDGVVELEVALCVLRCSVAEQCLIWHVDMFHLRLSTSSERDGRHLTQLSVSAPQAADEEADDCEYEAGE